MLLTSLFSYDFRYIETPMRLKSYENIAIKQIIK